MLQTLFTGHTMPLAYIAWVGPILQETRPGGLFETQKVMFMDIGILNSPPIRHQFISCDMYGQMTNQQTDAWAVSFDLATEQRHELIADWDLALQEDYTQFK